MKFKVSRLEIAIAFLALSIAKPALASRKAYIDGANVPIYDSIGEKKQILLQLKRGSEVASSNYPTNGYYKVKSGATEGWIRVDQLILGDAIEIAPEKTEAPMKAQADEVFIGKVEDQAPIVKKSKGKRVHSRDIGVRNYWRR